MKEGHIKRHSVAWWLECKTRQTCIYLYRSVPMNEETVLTPDLSKVVCETACLPSEDQLSPVLSLSQSKGQIHGNVLFQ